MRHISFYGQDLFLENLVLEKLDIWDKKHKEAIKHVRDNVAREMCYDVMIDIDNDLEVKNSAGNLFLAKNNDGYFGYMKISNVWNGEIVLVSIIDEKLRGQGLGKVLLTSVSDYLLNSGDAENIKLYIKKNNLSCIKMVEGCGFTNHGQSSENVFVYCKRIE